MSDLSLNLNNDAWISTLRSHLAAEWFGAGTVSQYMGVARHFLADLDKLALGGCGAQNGRHASLYIFILRGPRGYTYAHRSATLPLSGTAPASAVALHAFDDLAGSSGVAKGNQDLVEHNLIQNLVSALLQRFGEAAREATVPLDQIRQPSAA